MSVVKVLKYLVILFALMASTAAGSANMIMDVLNAHRDRYSTLIQTIQTAGMTDTLQNGRQASY